MSLFSTHVSCAGRSVTVSSGTRFIADWVQRYFAPWWSVADRRVADIDRLVRADVDHGRARGAITRVRGNPAATAVRYAGGELTFLREGAVVHAAQEGLAYRYAPGEALEILGMQRLDVAVSAARLAREVLRGRLLGDGWLLLRASAAVGPCGRAVLALGGKGTGKTTAAFLLAQAPGWSLLSDDRIFVRPDRGGLVEALAWPSTVSVGFGLLEAGGWSAPVRERGLSDPARQATDVMAGGLRPLRAGQELRSRFRPDQLRDGLGLSLAMHGVVSHLLFPMIGPYARAGRLNEARRFAEADVITASRDDRYPDAFGLTLTADDPKYLVNALGGLPQDSVLLGHDADGSRAFLLDLISRPS